MCNTDFGWFVAYGIMGYVAFVLLIVSLLQVAKAEITEVSSLFETKLSEYSERAKELSKHQLSPNDISQLTEAAMSIIDDMRAKTISEKLQCTSISLRYLDGQSFPDMSRHTGNSECDQRIVGFTIASYTLYRLLDKELVSAIVQKSPLELVSILRELDVFFKFVSAEPQDFGHGVFREKQDDTVIVFATNDAILRIMKSLIYQNFLSKNRVIYKMSRVTSQIANAGAGEVNREALEGIVSNLKRNTRDDARITIYIPKEST
ncbi:MAG: hypothetical protein IJ599_00685 [Alphaproteobacteria bacterium]|nr:hypothetical protein [Alphaproteobacteria bacterium]